MMMNRKEIIGQNGNGGEHYFLPEYQTLAATGADIKCCDDTVIPSGKIVLIPTGYSLDNETASSYVGFLLFARSSLAYKRGLLLANGVGLIDPDYRDEIKVMLYNTTDEDVIIKQGERIAQLVPLNHDVSNRPYTWVQKLDPREGGFGSTGGHNV